MSKTVNTSQVHSTSFSESKKHYNAASIIDHAKVTTNHRRYAILSKESIKMISESGTHPTVSDEVSSLLAEDTSYRIREAVNVSMQYARHCRRVKLKVTDVNKALSAMDVQPVYGQTALGEQQFIKCKDDLFYSLDDTIDLYTESMSSVKMNPSLPISISGRWLGHPTESQPSMLPPQSDVCEEYLCQILDAIQNSDCELFKIALNDLKTNAKISPVIPALLNYIVKNIKASDSSVSEMMKILYVIRAVTSNLQINLTSTHISTIVDSTMYCILDQHIFSTQPLSDHWSLRDCAANVLADIIQNWGKYFETLYTSVVTMLQNHLADVTKSFCSHYGAVVAMVALGHKCMEETLLPELSIYWNHLDLTLNDPSCANTQLMADGLKVYGALLTAVHMVLQRKIRRFTESYMISESQEKQLENEVESFNNINEIYKEAYEYFGDSLAIRLPEVDTKHIFRGVQRIQDVYLGDNDTDKTGEELLQELLTEKEDT